MNGEKSQSITWKKRVIRSFIFPFLVLLIYGVLFAVMPEKAIAAFSSSGRVLLNIIVPLGFVFILLVVFNIFLKPVNIIKFLGKESGIKGMVLSSAAGIVSVGPVYAWYPLLKELREKGAMNFLIAVFINSRAVKPFLLPVMISYFGLKYVIILTIFTIAGSFVAGYFTGALAKD